MPVTSARGFPWRTRSAEPQLDGEARILARQAGKGARPEMRLGWGARCKGAHSLMIYRVWMPNSSSN